MIDAHGSEYQYQVGGSLERGAPSYAVREMDEEFYRALKQGEFCYVLNSRQMGKSSLRVRTMERLQSEGIACGVIDITSIGSHDITDAQWYLGVIRRLTRSFKLDVKPMQWWKAHEGISPVQRLSEFVDDIFLPQIINPIVIFIDEIDSILRLKFKDDFFALIRSFYNQRADIPNYRRLTITLLGVATPSDLIQDKNRTPFNIGRAINLCGFQLNEAQPLAQGFLGKADEIYDLLHIVLSWTGGQPFLTQKVCNLISKSPDYIKTGQEESKVEQIIVSKIIDNWEAQDEPEHLRTIRNRLLQDERSKRKLLGLYQQILQKGEIKFDGSAEQMELRLTGLIIEKQGLLYPHNRIYESVFSLKWVNEVLSELRPYAVSIEAWLSSGKTDQSRLLRGNALEEAENWASDKQLGEEDTQFLRASERFEKRLIEEENQILEETNYKVKKRLTLTGIVLTISFIFLLSSSVWAIHMLEYAKNQRKIAQNLEYKIEKLNRDLANVKNELNKQIEIQQEVKIIRDKQVDSPFSTLESKVQEKVIKTVSTWLNVKNKIFAPPFDENLVHELSTGELNLDILKEDGAIDWLKSNNAYYKYGNEKIISIEKFIADRNSAILVANIYQERELFQNGSKTKGNNWFGNVLVSYHLKLEEGKWKIYNAESIRPIP